jgi:hypothetical protein
MLLAILSARATEEIKESFDRRRRLEEAHRGQQAAESWRAHLDELGPEPTRVRQYQEQRRAISEVAGSSPVIISFA